MVLVIKNITLEEMLVQDLLHQIFLPLKLMLQEETHTKEEVQVEIEQTDQQVTIDSLVVAEVTQA